MPKKSVREMTKLERMRHSLSSRVFRSVLLGFILLGVICALIGLGLYSVAVAKQDISTAFNLSRNASAILEKTADTEAVSREVMTRYRSLSDTDRTDPYSDAYTARFADIYDREDYQAIRSMLSDFRESSDVYAIYLAMYDKKTDAIVYIVDPEPDPDQQCKPGEWESVTDEGLDKFLNWDGTGMLYDIGKTEIYGWMCTAGVPVRSSSGEVTGFVLSDITLENVVSGIRKFVFQPEPDGRPLHLQQRDRRHLSLLAARAGRHRRSGFRHQRRHAGAVSRRRLPGGRRARRVRAFRCQEKEGDRRIKRFL